VTPEYDEAMIPDVADPIPDSDVHTCIDCGTPVPPTKSGRQFERCIDCRRAARASTGGSVSKSSGTRSNWEGPLASQLTELIQGLGAGISLIDKYDGMVIMQGGERLGHSLIGPARTNRKVRTALENMVQGGAWAAVVMASAAIIVPILAHHKLIPNVATPKPPAPGPSPDMVGHVSV